MTAQRITLTDSELGLLSLALLKCDAMAYIGVLERPWCDDHDLKETEWVILKINKMREEFP